MTKPALQSSEDKVITYWNKIVDLKSTNNYDFFSVTNVVKNLSMDPAIKNLSLVSEKVTNKETVQNKAIAAKEDVVDETKTSPVIMKRYKYHEKLMSNRQHSKLNLGALKDITNYQNTSSADQKSTSIQGTPASLTLGSRQKKSQKNVPMLDLSHYGFVSRKPGSQPQQKETKAKFDLKISQEIILSSFQSNKAGLKLGVKSGSPFTPLSSRKKITETDSNKSFRTAASQFSPMQSPMSMKRFVNPYSTWSGKTKNLDVNAASKFNHASPNISSISRNSIGSFTNPNESRKSFNSSQSSLSEIYKKCFNMNSGDYSSSLLQESSVNSTVVQVNDREHSRHSPETTRWQTTRDDAKPSTSAWTNQVSDLEEPILSDSILML